MELNGETLFLEDDRRESHLCRSLYLASSGYRPNPDLGADKEVEGETLRRVLKGAARMSLGIEPDGYRGITQAKADGLLHYLFGRAQDVVPESWCETSR